jgi:hypothetical protein
MEVAIGEGGLFSPWGRKTSASRHCQALAGLGGQPGSLPLLTLDAHGGNRSHTARTLGLQRSYLVRLIRQYLGPRRFTR